ncbi:MAG TPA: NAD-dependent epimerase/dehydratase family protein [Candidatus Nanoarchaeia archaeon]
MKEPIFRRPPNVNEMGTASKLDNLKFDTASKKPTALVAGGASFLGSPLCEALIAQGFSVIAVDNLATTGSRGNIEGLLGSPYFSFWEEDINKPEFKLSRNISLSHIFHLAAAEEHLSSSRLSLQTLLVNSLGTKNLLDLAVERGAKFLLVSSTEVFHGALSQVSLEAYFGKEADTAQLTFGEAKRFAETLTAEYFKTYDLATTIVRIKDPYGPRMNLAESVPLTNLINQALNKGKIELVGDGLRTLNPTYVTDIVFGIVKAGVRFHKGEIFNIINPERQTERAIAEALKKNISKLEIVNIKGDEFEPPYYPLILNPAQEKLGWTPKVPFPQGLIETIEFFRKKGPEKKPPVASESPKLIASVPKLGKVKRRALVLRRLILAALIALISWVIILPPALFLANIHVGNRNIDGAGKSLAADDLDAASLKAQRAESAFKASEEATGNFFWPDILPWFKEPMRQTKDYLFFAENISAATKSAIGGLMLFEAASNDKGEKAILGGVEEAKMKIKQAKRNLAIAASVDIEKDKLPGFLKGSYQNLIKEGQGLEELLDAIEATLEKNF